MKLTRMTWLLLCLGLAVPLFAGSTARSYQEARQVLDAGIQAMGGLEALLGIKDVSREGSGTSYALGQSLTPDGACCCCWRTSAPRRCGAWERTRSTGGVTG